MKFFKIVFGLFLFISMSLFPKFYSIRSQRELDLKLHDFEYSFVCFAPINQDGMHIKDMMRSLANSDDFQDAMDYGLVVLFVNVEVDTFSFARAIDYTGKPLFALFNHEKMIAQSDLGHHYTIAVMKKFVLDALAKDSEPSLVLPDKKVVASEKIERLEHIHLHLHHKDDARQAQKSKDKVLSANIDADYDADNEYEKKPTKEEVRAAKIQAGYQPIDLMKKEQPYWWNRGSGSSDYGRGGLKYREYFPKI